MSEVSTFSKETPFFATIKERSSLSLEGSSKKTHHIILDICGSGIRYQPGDCVAILPTNPPELVERTIQALNSHKEDLIYDPQGHQTPLLGFLMHKANISRVPKSLLRLFESREELPSQKRAFLKQLLEDRNALNGYLEDRELWDFLEEYPQVRLLAQELIPHLSTLLPRFYSIASSQSSVGDEIHLVVRHLEYSSREIRRLGICTHYLCSYASLNTPFVPIYIQPSHAFSLPNNHEHPIIMVGPGTGVAPYLGFMQERLAKKATGGHWLFFGEWSSKTEFYFESYWNSLVNDRFLRLDTAFSRDQEEKIYVQHRMWEQRQELWRWLEEGAYFYVCGDAKRMAPDVEKTLLAIISSEGALSLEEAKSYLKRLRHEKRYQRDVY